MLNSGEKNSRFGKNSYSVRIAKYWNKLPDNITNVPSINAFKNRLDKHWKDEDIYYLDYKSEMEKVRFKESDVFLRNELVSGSYWLCNIFHASIISPRIRLYANVGYGFFF
jgi:hypothetical protein